jgi:hypothetical protein
MPARHVPTLVLAAAAAALVACDGADRAVRTDQSTGIYLNSRSDIFFPNIQHRGGDRQDYSAVVTKPSAVSANAAQY